jgi:hypothetical protein
MIGAGNTGRLLWRGLMGSPVGWRKLATDARHERSPRGGLFGEAWSAVRPGCMAVGTHILFGHAVRLWR